jgi:hypothetical protein
MPEPKDTENRAAEPGAPDDAEQAHRERMDELKERTKQLNFGTRILKNTGNVAGRMLKNMGPGDKN